MSRTNNPNIDNINADTAVEVNVVSTQFNNVSEGGNIGGNTGARLYLSENGEARLVQKNILFQQAARLYDFNKGDWTTTGINLVPNETDRKNLVRQTKIELQNEIAKRRRSGVNQKDVLFGTNNSTNDEQNQEPDTQETEGNDNGGLGFAGFKGLQSSDSLLQRLSLKNLKYPIDADYGYTQDYIQINQFTYQPINPSILFPQGSGGQDTRGRGGTGTGDFGRDFDDPEYGTVPPSTYGSEARKTALYGLSSNSPKEIPVGVVKLPMPNQLNDSNNVAWGEDQLNALTAAAATLASGGLDETIGFIQSIADNKYKNPLDVIGAILSGAGEKGRSVADFLKQASANPNSRLSARSIVGSSLLNLVGFGVSPEALLARGAGVVPNSNLALLFNAPTLRAFRFDWKMSPRSQEEAIRINNIIRFFKQGMAAKKMMENNGRGYFLGTPNVFDISFKTSRSGYEITNTNDSVLRIKTCACVGAAVNYTPEGMWNAYEKGQPTSCILSLQFKELEPIYNTDYDEDPFNYDDLSSYVPSNAVGY